MNTTTIFVEKSLEMFENELYDEWIEYFKSELLKIENYELIIELELEKKSRRLISSALLVHAI